MKTLDVSVLVVCVLFLLLVCAFAQSKQPTDAEKLDLYQAQSVTNDLYAKWQASPEHKAALEADTKDKDSKAYKAYLESATGLQTKATALFKKYDVDTSKFNIGPKMEFVPVEAKK